MDKKKVKKDSPAESTTALTDHKENQSLKSRFTQIRSNNTIIIASLALIVLLLISAGLWVSKNVDVKVTPKQTQQQPNNSTPSQRPPEVRFNNYKNIDKFKLDNATPSGILKYSFKYAFQENEVADFASKFGLSQKINLKEGEDPEWLIYTDSKNNQGGVLAFYKKTGIFSYQSFAGAPLPNQEGQSLNSSVHNYLLEKGAIDDTVTCPISYQKNYLPDVQFIECHRDWEIVQLPILNFYGLLNLPDSNRLKNLALGSLSEDIYDQSVITNLTNQTATSFSSDKSLRPNDFNTVTVAVAKDSKQILRIESNLRRLTNVSSIEQDQLITPEQAISLFKSGDTQDVEQFQVPQGSGQLDLKKVYPNNKALAKDATITDYMLTYLEDPSSVVQYDLQPTYLIKGSAKLDSGYQINFVQAVSAVKSNLVAFNGRKPEVAGVSLAQAEQDQIKIDSFDPNKTPGPTSTSQPTNQPSTPPPPPTEKDPVYQCVQPPQRINEVGAPVAPEFTWDVPGKGKITVFSYSGFNTFFLGSTTFPIQSMDEALEIFRDLNIEQLTISLARKYANQLKEMPLPTNREAVHKKLADLQNLFQNGKIQSSYPISKDERLIEINTFLNYTPDIKSKTLDKLTDAINQQKLDEIASRPNVLPDHLLKAIGASLRLMWQPGTILGRGQITACYLSGVSPSIYVYSPISQPVTITSGSPLTFQNPVGQALKGQTNWKLQTKGDKLFQDGMSFDRVYYEYDGLKLKFSESNTGFMVSKSDLANFVQQTLSPKLGLTSTETEDLVADVKTSLVGKSPANYFKVSLINPTELDSKLPLKVSPAPTSIYRYHLLLTPLNQPISVVEPQLIPIKRIGLTVVELGVYTK